MVYFLFRQVRLKLYVVHLTERDAAHLVYCQLFLLSLERHTRIDTLALLLVKLQLPVGAFTQAVRRNVMIVAHGARERCEHRRAVQARVWFN